MEELLKTTAGDVTQLKYALDTFYFLVMGALVMWMAAGFAMLEAGLVRAKNTTEILTKNVVLVEGILAFVVLLSGQFVVTWLSVRFKWVDSLVKSDPRLLYHDGQYLHKAMKDERVTEEEVISAVREQGMASMEEVQAVILETNGTITTVRKTSQPATAMRSVNGWKEHDQNNNPQA